jgi:hypothetical protein
MAMPSRDFSEMSKAVDAIVSDGAEDGSSGTEVMDGTGLSLNLFDNGSSGVCMKSLISTRTRELCRVSLSTFSQRSRLTTVTWASAINRSVPLLI